jgi:hypothetical protein
VGLVYDHRGLPEVTTARPGVAGVLQVHSSLYMVVEASYNRWDEATINVVWIVFSGRCSIRSTSNIQHNTIT